MQWAFATIFVCLEVTGSTGTHQLKDWVDHVNTALLDIVQCARKKRKAELNGWLNSIFSKARNTGIMYLDCEIWNNTGWNSVFIGYQSLQLRNLLSLCLVSFSWWGMETVHACTVCGKKWCRVSPQGPRVVSSYSSVACACLTVSNLQAAGRKKILSGPVVRVETVDSPSMVLSQAGGILPALAAWVILDHSKGNGRFPACHPFPLSASYLDTWSVTLTSDRSQGAALARGAHH